MSSRKLQALDFVKRYFARWGRSPTLGELSAELGVSRKRAHYLVHELAKAEMIRHEAGKPRGIHLIGHNEELSEADVLLRLASMGWTITYHDFVIEARPPAAPDSQSSAGSILQAVTEKGLHTLPILDHKPIGATGEGKSGKTRKGRDGPRPPAAARAAPGRTPGGLGAPAS